MTEADVIAHWRKGAKDALESAKILCQAGQYSGALFNCHLAIEKALKAQVMEKTKKPHPKIHELSALAELVKNDWSMEDEDMFEELSNFAIAARYDDPLWAEKQATKENVERWILRIDVFLSQFLP